MTVPHPETWTNCDVSLREKWTRLSKIGHETGEDLRWILLASLSREELEGFLVDWGTFALPHQWPPLYAINGAPWSTWLLMGGRGAGKTLAGAQWVRRITALKPPVSPIALIGETEHDAREVMIEGV